MSVSLLLNYKREKNSFIFLTLHQLEKNAPNSPKKVQKLQFFVTIVFAVFDTAAQDINSAGG